MRRRAGAARRRGRRSAARACAARRARRYSPPSTASAAVSGRIAVPALPRKVGRCDRRARRPTPVTIDTLAVVRARRTPSVSQRIEHDARVVGIEQVVDRGLPVAQRGQQQHAVRDALRAGQPTVPPRGRGRDIEECGSCTCACVFAADLARDAARGLDALHVPFRARASLACAIRSSSASPLPDSIAVLHRIEHVPEVRRLRQQLVRGWRAGCRATSSGRWPRCA